MDQLLTAGDAARRLGVTSSAVRWMAARGDLPVAVTTEGGVRLFRVGDVEALRAWRDARSERRARARGQEPDAKNNERRRVAPAA
jgi:DNA-binding transcriptional MerR regulator